MCCRKWPGKGALLTWPLLLLVLETQHGAGWTQQCGFYVPIFTKFLIEENLNKEFQLSE